MKNTLKLWMTSVAAALASSPLAAQEAMSIDAKVNEAFASLTGP